MNHEQIKLLQQGTNIQSVNNCGKYTVIPWQGCAAITAHLPILRIQLNH